MGQSVCRHSRTVPYYRAFVCCLLLITPAPTPGQRVANPAANVAVATPTWAAGTGPRVLIDGGHRNFHTLTGHYAPFAALLRNDGYRVEANPISFTRHSLAKMNVLVIANAAAPEGAVSAFSDAEVAAVRAWVRAGGSLLLIADHAPFAGAAASMGKAFKVSFRNYYASYAGRRGQDVFRRGSGLADHVISRGACGDPSVTAVRSFIGSAFEAPGADPLLTLGGDFVLMRVPLGRATANEPRTSAKGLLQGATRRFGRGRVAVLGEAAMFSSQLEGPRKVVMGFGAVGAEQNQQFTLNLLHWLSGRPGC